MTREEFHKVCEEAGFRRGGFANVWLGPDTVAIWNHGPVDVSGSDGHTVAVCNTPSVLLEALRERVELGDLRKQVEELRAQKVEPLWEWQNYCGHPGSVSPTVLRDTVARIRLETINGVVEHDLHWREALGIAEALRECVRRAQTGGP